MICCFPRITKLIHTCYPYLLKNNYKGYYVLYPFIRGRRGVYLKGFLSRKTIFVQKKISTKSTISLNKPILALLQLQTIDISVRMAGLLMRTGNMQEFVVNYARKRSVGSPRRTNSLFQSISSTCEHEIVMFCCDIKLKSFYCLLKYVIRQI